MEKALSLNLLLEVSRLFTNRMKKNMLAVIFSFMFEFYESNIVKFFEMKGIKTNICQLIKSFEFKTLKKVTTNE